MGRFASVNARMLLGHCSPLRPAGLDDDGGRAADAQQRYAPVVDAWQL